MEEFARQIIAFITAHPNLAVFVIGAVAFGESLAFVSFIFPGTTVMVAAGTLIQAGAIDPVSAAAAGGIGAVIGDLVSYWIGGKFGPALPRLWPIRKHPEALERSVRFFERYGWASIFIGRFFGPLRAFVPLAAGMCRMRAVPFYTANILSAVIWAPGLLFSGYLLHLVYVSDLSAEHKLTLLAGAAVAAVVLVYAMRRLFRVR